MVDNRTRNPGYGYVVIVRFYYLPSVGEYPIYSPTQSYREVDVKECNICNERKSLSAFYKDKQNTDGYYSRCKECHLSFIKAKRDEKQKLIDGLKTECVICGEDRYWVLDFHHKDQTKKDFTIANAVSKNYGKDKIIKEVNKCIVVCSNCHRHIHHIRKIG